MTNLIPDSCQIGDDRQQNRDDRHRVDQKLWPSRLEIAPEKSGQENAANCDDQVLDSEENFCRKKSTRFVDPRSDQSSENDDGYAGKKNHFLSHINSKVI